MVGRLAGVLTPVLLLQLGWAAPLAARASQVVPPDPSPDTIVIVEEEIELRNLPDAPRPIPSGWGTGIWEWDREGLLSTRALTLLELLEEIPGLVPLRGGDYGQPSGITAFGLEGGRVRVFLDGAEMAPLGGGVVDLSQVGLAGFDQVRVERRPGELRIELRPLRFRDALPITLLEVGTGDLNTNLFRGTFGHPSALGGNVAATLDRIDTEGPFRGEPGVSFGAHLRHTLFLGERGGVAWELRRMTSRRPAELWAPPAVTRTDLALQGRVEAAPGVLLRAYLHRSSLAPDGDAAPEPGTAGWVNEDPRSQAGFAVSGQRGPLWAEGELRQSWGDGWPSSFQAVRGGGALVGLGGVAAGLERESWRGGDGVGVHLRGWTDPVYGFSLFGEVEDGRRGVPFEPSVEPAGDPEADPPDPFVAREGPSFTERTGARGGIEWRRGALALGVAALRIEADSLHPLGLPLDREGVVTAGGIRTGTEASVSLPLSPLLDGLSLQGSAQLWEDEEGWRYLPRRMFRGGLRYHGTFFPTGNLEVWTDIGVRGRDAMWIPLAPADGLLPLTRVPSQQSWYGRLQVRIVSVRLFVVWDNLTVREGNQDFPGRVLPPTRALYGVRWTLWN